MEAELKNKIRQHPHIVKLEQELAIAKEKEKLSLPGQKKDYSSRNRITAQIFRDSKEIELVTLK